MYPVKKQFMSRLIRAADPHHYDQILFTDPHRCLNNQLPGSLSEYRYACERQGASRRFHGGELPAASALRLTVLEYQDKLPGKAD